MTATTPGVGIIGMLGFWLLGGIVLRLCGALLMLTGRLALPPLEMPAGLAVVAVGVALRLAGHWHFVLRHRV